VGAMLRLRRNVGKINQAIENPGKNGAGIEPAQGAVGKAEPKAPGAGKSKRRLLPAPDLRRPALLGGNHADRERGQPTPPVAQDDAAENLTSGKDVLGKPQIQS